MGLPAIAVNRDAFVPSVRRISCRSPDGDRSAAISSSCSRAARRSSTISSAILLRGREIGRVLHALVAQPEDVEVHLVPLHTRSS